MKWNFRDAIISIVLLIFCTPSFAATHTIYGFERAKDLKNQSNGEYYIQAGSFLHRDKAVNYKAYLQSRTNFPVNIWRQLCR